jgi:hypothetical protein
MALAIVTFVLITLGQAIDQFDRVLKTVLRTPKDAPDPEPLRLRVIARAALAAAIAAIFLLVAFLAR